MKIVNGVLLGVKNKDIKRGEFIVPDSVTSIGDYVFYHCTSLTSVTIPNSVTSIGEGAFADCTSLTTVTIPDSVTGIGSNAFYYCTSLTSVTIPDSVTSIGNYVFYNCTSLTNVTIGDSVTSIGDSAFAFCKSLVSFTVSDNNSCYSSDVDGVLYNKDKSTLIQYPIGNERSAYTIPDSVTSIGDWAFYDCTSLTSVTIGDSVTSIGEGVFWGCTSLTSVTIPDSVTSIDGNAFAYCEALTNVTITDSVTSIGKCAFYGCTSLKSKRKNYKAFQPNLSCRGYQFKIEKWSDEITDIQPCEKGYHYCKNLFEIFDYYYGQYEKDFVIYECEVGVEIKCTHYGSKFVTNRIKPVKKLEWKEVIALMNDTQAVEVKE